MPHLPAPERVLRLASRGVAAGMVVEITLIACQAARGVESQFNQATAFDTAVSAVMGVTIVASMALVVWVLARSWRREFDAAPAFAWGIRLSVPVAPVTVRRVVEARLEVHEQQDGAHRDAGSAVMRLPSADSARAPVRRPR